MVPGDIGGVGNTIVNTEWNQKVYYHVSVGTIFEFSLMMFIRLYKQVAREL